MSEFKDGEIISCANFSEDNDTLLARVGSKRSKDRNHLHYYDNPNSNSVYHESTFPVTTRLVKLKVHKKSIKINDGINEHTTATSKLGTALRMFMKWTLLQSDK